MKAQEKARAEALRTELVKLAAERETLLTVVKRDLETQCYLAIGQRQCEFLVMRIEVQRIKRKIEMMRVSLNRGERYDLELIERRLDEELAQWESEVYDFFRKIQYAEYIHNLPRLSAADAQALRRLFHRLVRLLHPDLNPDAPEADKYLWNRIIAAYENGDLEEMRALLLVVTENKCEEKSPAAPEDSKSAVQKARDGITHLLKDLHSIEARFPFNMRGKLADDAWVKEQQDALTRQIAQLGEQKLSYSSLLQHLVAASEPTSKLVH